MAYFAHIDESGTVLEVISISNAVAPDPAPNYSEPLGQAFIADTLGLPGLWKQCSYSGSIRKQYPGPGYRYDANADVFVAPQPFPSWTLDADHDWQPPTPRPNDGNLYNWNEATLSWVALT